MSASPCAPGPAPGPEGTSQCDLVLCDKEGGSELEGIYKRSQWPGAAESAAMFQQWEEAQDMAWLQRLANTPQLSEKQGEGVMCRQQNLSAQVLQQVPDWAPHKYIVRVAVAAISFTQLRVSDLCTPEIVQLIWLVLGEVRLRAHKGGLYYFDTTRRSWRPCSGVLPENTYSYLRAFMNQVEGFFRCADGRIGRTQEAVVSSMQIQIEAEDAATLGAQIKQCLNKWTEASLWMKGSKKNKAIETETQADAEMEAPIPDGLPWTIQTATDCKLATAKIIGALICTKGDTLRNFCEWCETEDPRVRGFVYSDRAVRYDEGPFPVTVVEEPSHEDNFYLSGPTGLLPVPSFLGDPLFGVIKKELDRAIRQTFWANSEGLRLESTSPLIL